MATSAIILSLREREVRWKRTRCNSKAERMAGLAAKFEAAEPQWRIDIFRQAKHLKAAAEHFRMKQGLKGALCSCIRFFHPRR